MSLAFVLLDFQRVGVRERAQCTSRSVDMQQFRDVSSTRNIYSTGTDTSDFIFKYVLTWEASVVFPGEVMSGGGGVPRERVLQQSFEFSGEVGDIIGCTHEETAAAVVEP